MEKLKEKAYCQIEGIFIRNNNFGNLLMVSPEGAFFFYKLKVKAFREVESLYYILYFIHALLASTAVGMNERRRR